MRLYNIIAQTQSQTCSLPGWLGSKEGWSEVRGTNGEVGSRTARFKCNIFKL